MSKTGGSTPAPWRKPGLARPKSELPPAAAIRALVDGAGRLAVRVTPGAKLELLEITGGRLLAKVRATPPQQTTDGS